MLLAVRPKHRFTSKGVTPAPFVGVSYKLHACCTRQPMGSAEARTVPAQDGANVHAVAAAGPGPRRGSCHLHSRQRRRQRAGGGAAPADPPAAAVQDLQGAAAVSVLSSSRALRLYPREGQAASLTGCTACDRRSRAGACMRSCARSDNDSTAQEVRCAVVA